MIEVKNLSKSFETKKAVNNLSFQVGRGEVLGFLGPNGAGKSTTMRMITGFLPPTAGQIKVGNFNIEENPIEARRLIGYLPENAPSYSDMTVTGFLRFTAEIRGITGIEQSKAVDKAIETCFLEAVEHQSVDTLSKGYRHRTCLAQSIIHDPEILILDEPTDGLDPNQKHEVRSLIKRMGEKKAIVFSTHILEEVEASCSRAIIIDQGQIVANGTPEELKRKSELAGTLLVTIGDADMKSCLSKISSLEGVKKAEEVDKCDSIFQLRVVPQDKDKSDVAAEKVFGLVKTEGWKIKELRIDEGKLDDVFRSITVSDTKKS